MVETIAPVVYGGRNPRYWLAVALHTLGATASAATFGLLLGALGNAGGGPWEYGVIAVIGAALLYALRELAGLPIPLPDLDRQVPLWWRNFFSHHVAAFLYGLGLGIGYLTFLSFGTLVAVTAGAIVSADPLIGAALVAPFGAARALGVLATSTTEPIEILDRLETGSARAWASRLNGAVLAAVAVVGLVSL